MYKLCKTEESAQRQRELEIGLLKLMTTCRYEEISVSYLCQQMQIPRKSFYRYFSSKDGALHALLDHTLIGYEAYYSTDSKVAGRTLQSDMELFFGFWVEQKPLLDALEKSGMSGVLIERSIIHAISEDVMPKRFLPGDSMEVCFHITRFAVCGLMSMVLFWHHGGYEQSIKEMAKTACRLLDRPLFPGAGAFYHQ